MSGNLTDDGATKASGKWAVRDMNARRMIDGKVQPRHHEILPGVFYALTFNQDAFMPEEHARRFLIDRAFQVTAPSGNIVPAMDPEASVRVLPNLLRPNQVIADVSELTHEALLTRALMAPGAPKFTSKTKRDTLIEFLLEENVRLGSARGASDADPAGGDDSSVEEMGADAVDKMFA
ncbi:hypothetical protein UFOVP469_12 [uncultured Caudovirales phage]|uniref:Uncharacterized protein n=1 Tax=uncultured Caudovirales phage TaxID=2100421 RepID=A0A6J5RCC0_9CAUD|nr:hypothetical protein UFOVP469_12 [uncultured Caudovirales phage]CAB4190175.1 hypothetical protein UFOVP1200_42 [uncultured Caudovirales phage]